MLSGSYSMAAAINNAGHIVGVSATTPGSWEIHAFSWHDGRMTDLGLLDGGFTNANDINNRGQIVGSSAASPTEYSTRAILWTR